MANCILAPKVLVGIAFESPAQSRKTVVAICHMGITTPTVSEESLPLTRTEFQIFAAKSQDTAKHMHTSTHTHKKRRFVY